MSSIEEIRSVRQKKLERLLSTFPDAYPARTSRTHSIGDVVSLFDGMRERNETVVVAGRIRALRPHGGSVFFDIEEDGVRIQGFLKKDEMQDPELFDLFIDTLDIGDFIEVRGVPYITKREERSLLVASWKILVKSLLPLPEKWHGLQDVEERYRTRALDLLSNEQSRSIFLTRSRSISFIRNFLVTHNFLEVETPVLQPIAGGTTARPFVTHHNALDIDLYLRIAPELYLKRLLVGGYERVFEIARNFRNEGIDITHNPEFTMLEAYATYWDYRALMHFIENMMRGLIAEIFQGDTFQYQGNSISVASEFESMTFYESLQKYALIEDLESWTDEDARVQASKFGITLAKGATKDMVLEDIFRKAVRPHLIQPTFVYDWPASLLPLAKRAESNALLSESFQLYMGGIELLKGFSELNDPLDQRARFEEQELLRNSGDDEAQRMDKDFLENLEYGMPPAAGFGVGLDRLCLLLTDTHNLREVILFPTLRPKDN